MDGINTLGPLLPTLEYLIDGGYGISGGVCKFTLLSANFRGRGKNILAKNVFLGPFSVY